MNLDGSPAIPMTTNVNKLVVYLEVIVSEVMCFACDRAGSVMTPSRFVSEVDSLLGFLYTLPFY